MEGVQVKNRTLFALALMMGLLLLPTGCGIIDPSRVLQPNELCSDHPDDAVPTFEDANLEAAVREDLEAFGEIGPRDDLTCGLLSGKTAFYPPANIRSLGGIQNFTSLTFLGLSGNSISDISPLSGLTSLMELGLSNNSISDISPLSGLTSLETLFLDINSITDISALSGLTSLTFLDLDDNPNLTDIQPLLDNTGLGAGTLVDLKSTNVSCTDVAALQAKGVRVESDCP